MKKFIYLKILDSSGLVFRIFFHILSLSLILNPHALKFCLNVISSNVSRRDKLRFFLLVFRYTYSYNICNDLSRPYYSKLDYSQLILLKSFTKNQKKSNSPCSMMDHIELKLAGLLYESGPDCLDEVNRDINTYIKETNSSLIRNDNNSKSKTVICHADMRQALADFLVFNEENEYNVFLVSGTFLGAVREKSILKHDYDLDFGYFSDQIDHQEFFEKIDRHSDFLIISRDIEYFDQIENNTVIRKSTGCVLVKLMHRSGVLIDVFFHVLSNGLIKHSSNVHSWYNKPFSLKRYEIEGLYVLGPSNYSQYLSENYGVDWYVEKKEFNFFNDTPNLSIPKNVDALCKLLRKLYYPNDAIRRSAFSLMCASGWICENEFDIKKLLK